MRKPRLALLLAACATLAATAAADLSAQQAGPARYGVWRMRSDAPPPASNVMTYEPWGDGGMRVTVEAVSARGENTKWGYVTGFDGVFRPVTGQENSETAVEVIDDRSTRISNRRNGRLTQVIVNTLSADGNTIENEYVRFDDAGKITGVGHAVYERVR